MTETIKHYFPLVLTILCALYAVYIIFHSIGILGDILKEVTQKNNKTLVAQALATELDLPIPTPVYVGNSLSTEEGYNFHNLFKLKLANGTIISLDSDSDIALYLIDVKSRNNTSVLTKLSTEEIESLYQLPSSVVYDKEQHLLYFHNNGTYTLFIRLYYNHRPGILFECQVPVETR